MQTPAEHDVTDEEPEPLDQMESSQYRLQVARGLILSQDRADVNIQRECGVPKNVKPHPAEPFPNGRGWSGTGSVGGRWWSKFFGCGIMVEEVTTFSTGKALAA